MEKGGQEKYLSYLMRICSLREYSRADIEKYIIKKGYSKEDSEKMIRRLEDEKFIDDARYANAYVRDKSTLAGWGARKIRYQLLSKGLSREVVDEAIDENYKQASEKMVKVLSVKWMTLEKKEEDEYLRRKKLEAYAASRGYSFDEIEIFLKNNKNDNSRAD